MHPSSQRAAETRRATKTHSRGPLAGNRCSIIAPRDIFPSTSDKRSRRSKRSFARVNPFNNEAPNRVKNPPSKFQPRDLPGRPIFFGEHDDEITRIALYVARVKPHSRDGWRRDARHDYVCHVLSVGFIRLRDLSRNTGEHAETDERERATREERVGGRERDQVNPGHVEPATGC